MHRIPSHFDEKELLVRREIKTKTTKGTEVKSTESLPLKFVDKSWCKLREGIRCL